jgi:lysophospholipase L1-like esterase
LAQKHPDINFVAVTAPLVAVQTGPKAWIKQLIGKQPNGYLDNVRRAEFNTQLRERYLASGRLFDLARIEAESTDKCCKIRVDGQEVEALNPELTNDGGHLNEQGQVLVATALLNFVSTLPSKQAAR